MYTGEKMRERKMRERERENEKKMSEKKMMTNHDKGEGKRER